MTKPSPRPLIYIIILYCMVLSVKQMVPPSKSPSIIQNFYVKNIKPLLTCNPNSFYIEIKFKSQKNKYVKGIEFTEYNATFILKNYSISLTELSPTIINHTSSYKEGYQVLQVIKIFHPPKSNKYLFLDRET